MLTNYILAFFASFFFIFTKSFQQLNVVHKEYWWIVPTSMTMALCEVYVIANVAQFGWGWLVFWIGLGSGLGSLAATYFHTSIMAFSPLKFFKGKLG
jgi:ABC-type uncharacterized transport system permease subunit